MFVVGVLVALAVATGWRRRKARERSAVFASGQRVVAPCTLRHPDQIGARWLHGTIEMGGGSVPVWTGNPDQISLRVELPPSRFEWRGTRSGAPEVMSIAPGLVIARMESPTGVIELGLMPADAEALSEHFVVT